MTKNTHYTVIETKEPKDSQIELSVSISSEYISSFEEKVLQNFAQDMEVEGFRKGKAPISMVKERVGAFQILEQSVQRAIQEIVPVIVEEQSIDAISLPEIQITKLAPDQAVELKMNFALMPKVELPEYKKLAKSIKTEKTVVEDAEITGYIDQILNSRATKNEAGETQKPELTDDFVKTLGDFKDVASFKEKLKENMQNEKEMQATQKKRVEIIEAIIKEAKVTVPDILIEEESHKMLEEFRGRVESMKMNFEEYLTSLKKTEDDLKKEWHSDAEKRAKMNVILPAIAQKESIKPEQKEIDHEISHLKEHYKGKDIDETRARVYVANVLTNEKVFQFLETLS